MPYGDVARIRRYGASAGDFPRVHPRFRIAAMSNGLTRVDELGSGLVACYDSTTGLYVHGVRFSGTLDGLR